MQEHIWENTGTHEKQNYLKLNLNRPKTTQTEGYIYTTAKQGAGESNQSNNLLP